jgi:hypothetical protein
MTKTIKSLGEIRNVSGKIYVRWSDSITLDNERGYSIAYGTSAEAGLSSCKIDKTWDDWRILRQVMEYQFVGGSCWIVTGDEVGTGADNEPLLANVKLIGKVGNNLLQTNWRKMEIEKDIADDEERLTRITDPIGISIVTKALDKNKKLLASMK